MLAIVMDGTITFGAPLKFLDNNKSIRNIFMGVVGAAGAYKLLCTFFYPGPGLKKQGENCAADCECDSSDCKSAASGQPKKCQ